MDKEAKVISCLRGSELTSALALAFEFDSSVAALVRPFPFGNLEPDQEHL